MREKFRISVEVIEYEDGTLTVQHLRPNGSLTDYYGEYLGPGQILKLGQILFTKSPLWDLYDEELIPSMIKQPKEYSQKVLTDEERERKRWEYKRKRIAPQVFERYGEFCQICGSEDNLTIDHIIPIAKGGSSELNNLQPLCRSCNSKKGANDGV